MNPPNGGQAADFQQLFQQMLQQLMQPQVIQPQPSPVVDEAQNKVITKLCSSGNSLWVTWLIKFEANDVKFFKSKNFNHPAINNKTWLLKLDTNGSPVLTLVCLDKPSQPGAGGGIRIAQPGIAGGVQVLQAMAAGGAHPGMADFGGVMHLFGDDRHALAGRPAPRIRAQLIYNGRNGQRPGNVLGFEDYVIVTSVSNGQVSELKHQLSEKQLQIPMADQIVKDPGSILTIKLEIRAMAKKQAPETTNDLFLKQLLDTNELHDIEFKSKDGQLVPAHKFVMAAVSPFVKARFLHDGVQSNVFETDFEAEDLKNWIDHIYRRSLIGDESKLVTIMNIFMISDYFGSEIVSQHCCELIADRISPSNVVAVIKHDMINLCGDQSAKIVQNAIIKMVESLAFDEIPEMDLRNPKIAAFMSKVVERTRKRKAGQAFETANANPIIIG